MDNYIVSHHPFEFRFYCNIQWYFVCYVASSCVFIVNETFMQISTCCYIIKQEIFCDKKKIRKQNKASHVVEDALIFATMMVCWKLSIHILLKYKKRHCLNDLLHHWLMYIYDNRIGKYTIHHHHHHQWSKKNDRKKTKN